MNKKHRTILEEKILELKGLQIDGGDSEYIHERADGILLEFLREAGFGELADEWKRTEDIVSFWYA